MVLLPVERDNSWPLVINAHLDGRSPKARSAGLATYPRPSRRRSGSMGRSVKMCPSPVAQHHWPVPFSTSWRGKVSEVLFALGEFRFCENIQWLKSFGSPWSICGQTELRPNRLFTKLSDMRPLRLKGLRYQVSSGRSHNWEFEAA